MLAMNQTAIPRAVAGAALAFCGLTPAVGDEVADFYRGRTLAVVIGHEVGTGFDIYGRLLARHLPRHIPGTPNAVVQNMVGASGIAAANWLYNVAPKDGTVMATFVHTVPFEPLFGNAAAKYDPANLAWIGNMEESLGTCGIAPASGITSFDELRHKEAVFGATGATGPLGKFAVAVKNLLGARIKLVYGYKGSASVKLAIQRGEVHGVCALPISTLKAFWRDELESGRFKPIIQLSGPKNAELAGVPHVDDYANTEDDRQLFGLIFGAQALGRIYGSPPGLPPQRMNALRRAFTATMNDPQFLAEAKTAQVDIVPNTGEEVAALIARYSASSKDVVDRAKRAFEPN
jgi:tripartite-type tricarboxylate transporter receptor subunit TctC